MYQSEINKIKAIVGHDLYNFLAEQGCYIAGGALTSVFTNAEINDVDIYFPSKEAFTQVMRAIYDVDGERDDFSYADAIVQHVSNKAVLVKANSGNSDVQFIAHKFYENALDIFKDFDFSINMAAIDMKSGNFVSTPYFFKHLGQRYLHVNTNTSYPLISTLRVDKYRKRGYNISKAQLLRLLLAVNAKEIDSWEKLADELGGMYGTAPEEIFDYSQPFSLQLAIDKLDNFEISDKLHTNCPEYEDVVKKLHFAFTQDEVRSVANNIQKKIETEEKYNLLYKDYRWHTPTDTESMKKELQQMEDLLK